MVILHNQSWFDINKYGSDSIIKESKLLWMPIEAYDPSFPYKAVEASAKISVTDMKL